MAKGTRESERQKTFGAAVAVAAMIAGLAAQLAAAQHSEGLVIDVAACVALDSPAERLACYDSRANAAQRERGDDTTARDAPEKGGSDFPARADEANAAEAGDGGTGPQRATAIRARSGDTEERELRAKNGGDDRAEFFGTVAALRETVPDKYLITLEDGQIWRQMRPEWYPLQIGHRVRIYPTRWGNAYRLSAEDLKGFIQVERVR